MLSDDRRLLSGSHGGQKKEKQDRRDLHVQPLQLWAQGPNSLQGSVRRGWVRGAERTGLEESAPQREPGGEGHGVQREPRSPREPGPRQVRTQEATEILRRVGTAEKTPKRQGTLTVPTATHLGPQWRSPDSHSTFIPLLPLEPERLRL